MQALFETGPVYDPHARSIVRLMLSRLRNNNPREDSKVYMKAIGYVTEIYDGTFLHRAFSVGRADYNYDGAFEKVRSCKGSWQEVRSSIITAMDNLEVAKDDRYLPYNKKFIESVTFSSFFELPDLKGGVTSMYVSLQNPPRKKAEKAYASRIADVRKNVIPAVASVADDVCEKYFSEGADGFQFWCAVEDFSRWLRKFKEVFPQVHGEFVLGCKDGNPMADLSSFVAEHSGRRYGDGTAPKPYFFRLTLPGRDKLGGMFLDWLQDGISRGKFACLKSLPKPVADYCEDSDFVGESVSGRPVSVVDLDTIIF